MTAGARIRFDCPDCGASIRTLAGQAGERCVCPKCGATVVVPGAESAAAPSSTGAAAPPSTPPSTPIPTSPPRSPVGPEGQPAPRRAAPPRDAAMESGFPLSHRPTAQDAPPAAPPPPSESRAATRPAEYGFSCRVCGTRLSVTAKQAGAPIACPDCFETTVAPLPPAARTPRAAPTPTGDDVMLQDDAFDRPRYEPVGKNLVTRSELDRADRAPPPAAAAPTTPTAPTAPTAPTKPSESRAGAAAFTFPCPTCGSSLIGEERRVGQTTRCSDCETVARIPPRPAQAASANAGLPEDREQWHEFRLSHVDERPSPHEDLARDAVRSAMQRAEEEARRAPGRAGARGGGPSNSSNAAAGANRPPAAPPASPGGAPQSNRPASAFPTTGSPSSATGERGAEPAANDSTHAPPPLRRPLTDAQLAPAPELLHAGRFLLQPAVGGMLLMLSMSWTVLLLLFYASTYFQQQGGLLPSLLCWIMAISLGIPTLMYSCAASVAIVQEIANGSDEVTASLAGWFDDFVSNIVFVGVGMLLALVPGGALRQILGSLSAHWWWDAALLAVGAGLFFPVILLSALEQGTLAPPVSRPVLSSLTAARTAWTRFYLESLILLAPTLVALRLSGHLTGVFFAGPLLAATFLLYFWRLGVLARRCADSIREHAP